MKAYYSLAVEYSFTADPRVTVLSLRATKKFVFTLSLSLYFLLFPFFRMQGPEGGSGGEAPQLGELIYCEVRLGS